MERGVPSVHCNVGEEVLLTVFSVDSTQSYPCTVQHVDADAVELQVHSPGKGKLKIPGDASGFLVGRGDEQPVSVLIDDASRLPTIRCVVERSGGQRRGYARASGYFPLRCRLLGQQEHLMAIEKYRSRATSLGIEGVVPAESWMASARDAEEWGPEIRYLARSLAELHRKMDLIISLLPQSRPTEGEDVKPTEVNISGSGIDFITEEELPVGDFLELEMWLPIAPNEKIVALGKILRVENVSQAAEEQPASTVAVHFTAIGEYEREKIVQYVFQRQREELRGRRLGASLLENNG